MRLPTWPRMHRSLPVQESSPRSAIHHHREIIPPKAAADDEYAEGTRHTLRRVGLPVRQKRTGRKGDAPR